MKKCNVVFNFFLVSVLFFGCQKKADNLGSVQSEPELSHVSGIIEEKPIEAQSADLVAPLEIEMPEIEPVAAEDFVSTDKETVATEDDTPETAEPEDAIEPVLPDEPKYSVAELIEMPYILDYLNVFFEEREYALIEEPQNVGSRYIYFAAHYVPGSPENAFDQFIAFQLKDGDVVPRFIVRDGKFIDDEGNILHDFLWHRPLHGFNFSFNITSMNVATYFVYDGNIGGADTFNIYWYEERETYDLMSQDDPNWMPGM